MPSKSAKQRKFMRAIAHGWEPTRMKNPPSKAVAKEFVAADKKAGYAGGGLATAVNMSLGGSMQNAIRRAQMLAAAQNALGSPSTMGGGLSGYHIPRAPTGPITPERMAPDSIAREIYDKYGIVDPTATRYDLTSQAAMREDPLIHLERDDPARRQYEQWTAVREAQAAPTPQADYYKPLSEMGGAHRDKLAEHQRRIASMLAPQETQNMRMGGLAQAVQRRKMMRPGGPGSLPGGGRFSGPRTRPLPSGPGSRGLPQGQEPIGAGMMGGPKIPPNLRGYLQKMRMMNRPGGMGQQRKQVGLGDQQGGLHRAMQTQTGRPPISRRAAFPGSRQNMY